MIAMRSRIVVVGCVLASAGLPVRAERGEYVVDPVHTRVAFTAGHAGFSKAIGTFAGTTGTLAFDEADWKSSKVEVSVPLASLDLGDAKWNKAVLGNMFLDADKLPRARFVSSSVEDLGGGKLKITGDLTLHGVTQSVVLDAKFNAHRKHPLTRRPTAGFSATAVLSRKQFELGAWPGVIDDRVDVLIELEAAAPKKSDEQAARGADTTDEELQPPDTDQGPGFEPRVDPAPATATATDEPADDASDTQ